MKTYMVGMAALAAAVITMAGSASAGTSPAEETALRHGVNRGSAQAWEERSPLETGNLPADGAKAAKPEAGAMAEVPTVEIGGTVYRIGIDLN